MRVVYGLLITALLTLFGCNSTKITSSWQAEGVQPKAYDKILVLALINEPDRSVREMVEANLVANLKDLGYNATCSCDDYGPKSFENMKEQEALAKLANSGIDAVLTVVLLDKKKERYYVPGRANYSPYAVSNNRFWGYYSMMYDRVYSEGYYVTDTKYFWESNFYSFDKKQQLLYSAQSRSFDLESTSRLTYEYGQKIVKDLLKRNIVADQAKQPGQSTEKKPLAF